MMDITNELESLPRPIFYQIQDYVGNIHSYKPTSYFQVTCCECSSRYYVDSTPCFRHRRATNTLEKCSHCRRVSCSQCHGYLCWRCRGYLGDTYLICTICDCY